MSKTDLRQQVLEELEEKYSRDRIVVEPTLDVESVLYPDIAVYRDIDREDLLLLVECSSLRTTHRSEQDLKEVSESVAETDASYGALVGPEVQFVFSGQSPNYRTLGGFPSVDDTEQPSPRAFQSQTELEFVLNRCLNDIERIPSPDLEYLRHEELVEISLEALHLVIEAQRQSQPLDQELDEHFVSELYDHLRERFDWYRTDEHLSPDILGTVAAVFSGYDLLETGSNELDPLFNIGDKRRNGEYATPTVLARQLVRLAKPESGQTVLDPAAGQGTILSFATGDNVKGFGVEINQSVIKLAAFYIDLLNRDVTLVPGDVFKLDWQKKDLPSEFDRIIIDPPFGGWIEGADIPYSERSKPKSEEAFLAKGLSLLTDGGTLTVTVPAGFLFNRRQKWLRELILDEFQLDSIIQIVDGPIYRYTSINTAILTISNTQPDPDHEVQYEIVESPESVKNALSNSVTIITDGAASTVKQADLDGSLDIKRQQEVKAARASLHTEFGDLTELASVAEVNRGNRPVDLVEKPHDDTLQYLSISDVSEGPSRHGDRYIFRDKTNIIADRNCVLVSTIGTEAYTHIPNEPVAPAQDLAVVRFDSPDAALVYQTFLNSEHGQNQLGSIRMGTTARHRIPVRNLREILVPEYGLEEVADRATAVREHEEKIAELEENKQRLKEQQEALASDASDLLKGGDSNE